VCIGGPGSLLTPSPMSKALTCSSLPHFTLIVRHGVMRCNVAARSGVGAAVTHLPARKCEFYGYRGVDVWLRSGTESVVLSGVSFLGLS
jgi:hypothetical protein